MNGTKFREYLGILLILLGAMGAINFYILDMSGLLESLLIVVVFLGFAYWHRIAYNIEGRGKESETKILQ